MRPAIIIITILTITLLLPCCRYDNTSRKSAESEEQKIEKEVTRRVEIVKTEIKTDLKTKEYSNRLRTIRVVGFVFLSTVAVGGLLWLHHPRFPNAQGRIAPVLITRPPEWVDHPTTPAGRVLDLTAQQSTATQSPIAMQSQPPRRRRRHETPRHS